MAAETDIFDELADVRDAEKEQFEMVLQGNFLGTEAELKTSTSKLKALLREAGFKTDSIECWSEDSNQYFEL